ncbi:hypothetical protein AeRB84_006993 [Aphanomyces euteiches]|nr:hypothetical protein AeRB84_006993 [Aphanomyces euteiches]
MSAAAAKMNERREAALQVHLMEEEAMSRIRLNKNSSQPANTNIQYSSKQLEFLEWNTNIGYPDEYVTEQKMVLFLTQVQCRPVRKSDRKRKNPLETNKFASSPSIGFHTLAAYVNSLMDLWRMQYELQQNNRVPIRPSSAKELLKQKKLASVRNEDEQYIDRGIGTMVDRVDEVSLQSIADAFFHENTEQGLKHRDDNLLSIALCSRGDNMRSLKLSTIGLIVFPNEGIHGASLFRCVWRKYKKNQYGNVEQTTFMRHKNVARCPFGALVVYFFYRWHVGDEPWPDFTSPKTWCDIFVLKGSSPTTQMTYSHQYKAIRQQHEAFGIQTTIRTQSGRKLPQHRKMVVRQANP